MTRGRRILWTGEMLDRVRKEYGRSYNSDLAAALGVGERSLRKKAAELGVSKDPCFRSWPETRRRESLGHYLCGRRYYLKEHPEVGEATRFRKGHSLPPEKERERREKARAARRMQTYSELVRLKHGLPQETGLRLKKRFLIDRSRYFPEEPGAAAKENI